MCAVGGAGRPGARARPLAGAADRGGGGGADGAGRAERWLDLLVDDSDGVVLGTVGIPPVPAGTADPAGVAGSGTDGGAGRLGGVGAGVGGGAGAGWLRTCQSLVRTLTAVRPARAASAFGSGPSRLRVEVDGTTLVDLDQPVEGVSLAPGAAGLAEVEVRRSSVGAEAVPLTAEGRTVTVSGAHFRYRADAVESGPVRTRTWVVREGAWGLTLPRTP